MSQINQYRFALSKILKVSLDSIHAYLILVRTASILEILYIEDK